MTTIHGTCVAIAGVGVLLRGPSGGGKSDLALRLIDEGAVLVADDRVEIGRDGDAVVASAPAALSGLMEVRGIGILAVPTTAASVRLALVVDLVSGNAEVERMPDPHSARMMDVDVPLIALHPLEASAAAKLRLAARAAAEGRLWRSPDLRA